jgi:excisionase family DNA binding protein
MNAADSQQSLVPPVTLPEFLALARCSKATAYRWVRSGKVPSVKIGKKILIPREALTKLLTPQEAA